MTQHELCIFRYTGMEKKTFARHVICVSICAVLTACGADTKTAEDALDVQVSENVAPGSNPSSSGNIDAPAVTTDVDMDSVELALATGAATHVNERHRLEDALLAAIDDSGTLHEDAIQQIFNLDSNGLPRIDGTSLISLDWNPTHDAALLDSEVGENRVLLATNSVSASGYDVQEHAIAVMGKSASRYMVFGGNPMRNYRRSTDAINDDMHRVLENSIAWLTERDNLKAQPFNVVMAQLSQSFYFPDELGVREWLDERFVGQATYNERNACDNAALSDCLTADSDLLIISQHMDSAGEAETIARTVNDAMDRGIPVLYLHLDGDLTELGKALLPLWDVRYKADNYWRRLSLDSYDASASRSLLSTELAALRETVQHFREDTFLVDWSECLGENCNSSESLDKQFLQGARYAQTLMRSLDDAKVDIFAIADKYRFKKLVALLGDHYRGNVNFPMDRLTTPTSAFLRALYADHTDYQFRQVVGVWSDLGNYSRTDFSHIEPTTRTVRHTSKQHIRATGAYALPGQTVTVTRNDASDVNVKISVNTLRNGSTHLYAADGYKRPHNLDTQAISIESGETLSFTSAMGGPIQLRYDANDLPVEVVFSNIGEHAYWGSVDDNESFSSSVYSDDFDWAEIATPSFEVHSTRSKMIESLSNEMFGPDGGTPQTLAEATTRYTHNFPHVLAGFRGPGVDVIDEIHEFATNNDLPVATLDLIKHMNADQALCGYGCSGNPYDAYWSFSPIGHGDIHELGHGLERARFRFTGWPTHASTNFYSYYSKSQYFKETGNEPSCQSLPFESLFNILQDSRTKANPAAYIQATLWDNVGWSQGATMFIQMMMAAEDNGALIDGWHLLARLHIIERAYQNAVKNEENWLATRTGLGMSSYSRDGALAMSREDWLLIAVSHATGFDYRAYFDVWAHSYTVEAGAQVASMSLPSMPLNYYVSSAAGFCKGEGFDGNKLPLDGAGHVWPEGS